MMSQSPNHRSESSASKAREERFHNEWANTVDPSEVLVEESWVASTCPEHRWIRSQLGPLRGKRILDLGCGAGEGAVFFAKMGAHVTAVDLSPHFLDLVRRVAHLHGTILETQVGDAENLPFNDDGFDIVYAGNVLHHVELPAALEEIHRVLKPGGTFACWDPLRHNPIINIYRRMARHVRTVDESPLAIGDLREFYVRFSTVTYQCFWLCTLWLFLRFYLVERAHPSQQRYWKKIIREHQRLEAGYHRLERLDKIILARVPYLRRHCWNIAICAKKK